MASRTSRKEWVRGLPSAFGVGRYGCKWIHWASERSVGYVSLIRDSVQNGANPHPYQTGSKTLSIISTFHRSVLSDSPASAARTATFCELGGYTTPSMVAPPKTLARTTAFWELRMLIGLGANGAPAELPYTSLCSMSAVGSETCTPSARPGGLFS